MKIVDYFKAAAGNAQRCLDALASEQESKLAAARAIAKVERRFEELAADGVLDPAEMEELRRLLRAQGIDTGALDRLWARASASDGVSVERGSRFGDLVRTTLSGAREDMRDSAADLSFRVQVAANEYTHSEEAASRLMKNEHDAYMAVIKNISG